MHDRLLIIFRRASRLVPAAMAVGTLALGAVPAFAAEYEGALSYYSDVTFTISDGQVTAFDARPVGVHCPNSGDMGHANLDGSFRLPPGTTVPVVGGAFRIDGEILSGYDDKFRWRFDGKVSLDGRRVTGTLATWGTEKFRGPCVSTYDVEAILAPRRVDTPVRRTFEPAPNNRSFNPSVSFSYKNGVITRLTAHVSTTCPNTTFYSAELNTTAYRLDPIKVSRRGTFRIQDVVLDGYGVPTHFDLRGRIQDGVASGRMESYRGNDGGNIDGQNIEKCETNTVWRSRSSGDAPGSQSPGAYLDVTAYRHGAQGSYSYFLGVRIETCFHANRVRVTIAGKTKVLRCGSRGLFGPLTPKRTYRVSAAALKTRKGKTVQKQRLPSSETYLPGEDGNWVPIR